DNQSNQIKEAIGFLRKHSNGIFMDEFAKIWLEKRWGGGGGISYFNFNGAKLPDISNDKQMMSAMPFTFQDTFLFSCILSDDYNKAIVGLFDQCMTEGPYGYKDGNFDVTVKENDIVMDVGAWIGDFSAYAASKGAVVYAFEPVHKSFELLKKTAELNEGKIHPVNLGLGKKEYESMIYINEKNISGSGMYFNDSKISEKIKIITLDKFVKDNNIKKVDFIKVDIEGAERDLLRGAREVLRKFAPKLAICTYHFPEDPELLEKIIVEANPKYKVAHTRQKLFARVN
ncbi:MAG: FkbM family methyltransferase, partial [Elusimicrobiota bacterium]|nr:FkbM family methyltransferase [Elusimicrobiota bacterium]